MKVLVADDEPRARRGLCRLLARDPEVEVVGEAADGVEAVEAIARLAPDVVFLDVQMPGLDGFQVLDRLDGAAAPAVVFVTAYDEHLLRAFDVEAVDYLLKPFTDERLARALARAKSARRGRLASELVERLLRLAAPPTESSPGTAEGELRRFAVTSRRGTDFVEVDAVDWLEAQGGWVRLHAAGRRHLVRGNLGSFEPRLPAGRFFRVGRSAIVRLARVTSLRALPGGHCLAVLADGTELRVAPGRRKALQAALVGGPGT